MDRQRGRRPARPRPVPSPGPPITSPSERPRRRAHGRGRSLAPCARAKPPSGRCTDVLSTPDLGVRYTYKAGTLHELTSRKAASSPLPQPCQTFTSALRRAHAAPAAPRRRSATARRSRGAHSASRGSVRWSARADWSSPCSRANSPDATSAQCRRYSRRTGGAISSGPQPNRRAASHICASTSRQAGSAADQAAQSNGTPGRARGRTWIVA